MAAAARKQDLYAAKLAKRVGKFDMMVDHMEKIVREHKELTAEEREFLSDAYENNIGSRLAVLKEISSMETKETELGNQNNVDSIRTYRERIESEISSICNDIFSLIDSILMPATCNSASKVFYYKMKGDYSGHLIKLKGGSERKAAIDNTLSFYQTAKEIAEAELEPLNPIRLSLLLNFSEFYYEVLNHPKIAYTVAKEAYDCATADGAIIIRDASFKDSFSMIQLLAQKVDSWKSELQ